MSQYDITVKIRVTVEEGGGMTEAEWADYVAKSYAEMALKYKSIGADQVIRVVVEPAPVQDIDWKDMYEKEKRRSEMWVAKYEKDIGPLEYATPVDVEPV
jgi:hypothetical protein